MGFSALIAAPYGIVMSMRVSLCWPTGVSLARRSSSAQGVVADLMLWNQATYYETLLAILCSNYNVTGFCTTWAAVISDAGQHGIWRQDSDIASAFRAISPARESTSQIVHRNAYHAQDGAGSGARNEMFINQLKANSDA